MRFDGPHMLKYPNPTPRSYNMQAEIKHLALVDLETGLEHIRNSPKDQGVLELIVNRPEEDAREVMELADLDITLGLVGDTWIDRPSSRSGDGKATRTCKSPS